MLYRICMLCLVSASLFGAEHIYLKTPGISRENIIGTAVGIRPYRKSGVRIEAEMIQDKLIIHNYGYGGSGLTTSFGGSQEVLDLLDQQLISSKKVAVLGAGVAGLVVAHDLLERGYEVHLYADKWNPDLTSNVAGGIWTPFDSSDALSDEKKDLQKRMAEISEQRFLRCVTENPPEFPGVVVRNHYRVLPESSDQTNNTARIGEEVILHLDNGLTRKGLKNQRLGIDGKIFMNALFAKVKNKGAILHQQHFEVLDDVLNVTEPVIINCMSMGSRKIFDDQEFLPVRGCLVYFKKDQEIDYLLHQGIPNSDYYVTIHSWDDRLIVGGVHQEGIEELIAPPEVIETLIENAEKCLSGRL